MLLFLNEEDDWECPFCQSKWCDTGYGPDFSSEDEDYYYEEEDNAITD